MRRLIALMVFTIAAIACSKKSDSENASGSTSTGSTNTNTQVSDAEEVLRLSELVKNFTFPDPSRSNNPNISFTFSISNELLFSSGDILSLHLANDCTDASIGSQEATVGTSSTEVSLSSAISESIHSIYIKLSNGTNSVCHENAFEFEFYVYCTEANRAALSFVVGDGSPEQPYLICNVNQLQLMNSDLTSSYLLGTDIDASSTASWLDPGGTSSGSGFVPIGANDSDFDDAMGVGFSGEFNGNGYTITGLTMNRARDTVGLFGYIAAGAIVKNFNLTNVSITQTDTGADQFTGGLAGVSDAELADVSVQGTIVGDENTGGLVGKCNAVTRNATTEVTVTGQNYTGGLCGAAFADILNSSSNAIVNGQDYTGGLIGESSENIIAGNSRGTVDGNDKVGGLVGSFLKNIFSSKSSSIVSARDEVGGLAGIGGAADASIYFSIATGATNGRDKVGGLVGSGYGIYDSAATGNVGGSNIIGGLIGVGTLSTFIERSASHGDVSGVNSVGGLLGQHSNYLFLRDSYSTSDINGSSYVGGLIGRGGDFDTLGQSQSIGRSYSSGSVTGNDASEYIGGLIGETDQPLYSSFSTGIVTNINGASKAFGIGSFASSALVNDLYWYDDPSSDTDFCFIASNTNCNSGGIPAAPSDFHLKTHGVYNVVSDEWNFDHIWSEKASDFPKLRAIEDLLNPTSTNFAGTGTAEEPFKISSAADWASISNNPDLLGKHYELNQDLDFTGFDCAMIGSLGNPFYGVLDGKGHLISNFNCSVATNDLSEKTHIGLIRSGYHAIIKNIRLSSVTVSGWSESAAMIGACENCEITGIKAENLSISGGSNVGGVLGRGDYTTVGKSYSTGAVSASRLNGGLVGTCSNCTVANSYSNATVTASGSNPPVGGLMGMATDSIIVKCFAAGSVTGNSTAPIVAGLIGAASTSTITDSFAAGLTINTGSGESSGIALGPSSGDITNVYWYDNPASDTVRCYWPSNTNCNDNGAPSSEADFYSLTQGVYADAAEPWDFTTIWNAPDGGYPTLR